MSKHDHTRPKKKSDVTFKLIPISLEFLNFRRETHWPKFKYYFIHNLRVFTINIIIYYWYSALGPVWAETRAQSGDWYGSGTLHPGQVLKGSLPLLSPAF